MSADKRSVFTDALETLGTIIDDSQKRDAIHLAVEPTVAKRVLFPGEDVDANGDVTGKLVGIVDPFLKDPVQIGQKFWLVIYPRQIKSLRHVWTHPDFNDTKDTYNEAVISSSMWMQTFAQSIRMDVNSLIAAADNYLTTGDYISTGSYEEHLPDEFWDHYTIITGKIVPQSDRGSFFSCSC
jgi:hypothetical protein